MPRSVRTITLIGAGHLANALGLALRAAGYRIAAVAARKPAASRRRAAALAKRLRSRMVPLEEAAPVSDLIWLCHTDDALASTARLLSRQPGWKGKIVFHSSGALSSDVLSPLRRAGAHVASLHPMMTFAVGSHRGFRDVSFAVEGDAPAVRAARKIARDLGSEIFPIHKSAKTLYHALGSFSSPLVIALLATAERIGQAAGLSVRQTRSLMLPILRQTIANYAQLGAAAAYGGPTKRGDVNTVRLHLRELKRVPGALELYRALVQSALIDLPTQKKDSLKKLMR